MTRYVFQTAIIVVALCLSCIEAYTIQWKRGQDGNLYVSVPDIAGTKNVTVTLEFGQEKAAFIPHKSADNWWKTVMDNLPNNEVFFYEIKYQMSEDYYILSGVHFPSDEEQEKGLTLGSEHYLRRRATTVFYDDFSSGGIDPKKWTHDIMAVGMAHFQIWSPESRNSYVKNGLLHIKPTLTVDRFGSDVFNSGTIDVKQIWGGCHPVWGSDSCVTHGRQNRPFMSALLRSSGHIRYGRVEVTAKLPRGDWIWPAIWMMPVEPGHYGGWPRSGEIDIVEAVGNEHLRHPNGKSVGVDCDHAHFNFGSERDGPGHIRYKGEYRLQGTTFADDFHTFWLDWTKDHIKLGVDSHTALTVNTPPGGFRNHENLKGTHIWDHGGLNAPFDRPFYLILDVAVGGAFFWEGYINSPYKRPWTTGASDDYYQLWQARHLWQPTWHGENTAMKVKSVKMVQY